MITKELELELRKSIFKQSYYEFFKWSFKILMPNEEYVDAPHVKELCDIYQAEVERIIRREQKTKDIIVNIPPRTSKTLITHTSLLPWVWTLDPTITMIVISFDEELVLLNAQYSKDIISSPEYQELYSDLFKMRREFDSKGLFMNDKGGFKMSKTTGSNITGHKGQIIIVDDPINPKNAESEVYRKNSIEYYTRSLYNRLTPVNLGVRIIIMQRLHEEDLSGYLIKKHPELYTHVCLPAEISDLVKPIKLREIYKEGLLDPKRLGKFILSSFKKILGSRGYSGQYDQTPSPDEGGIFKKVWYDIVRPETLQRNTLTEPIHFFIDSAYTDKTENDPTAILAGFKQGNFFFVLDVVEVWMTFPDLLKFIPDHVSKYQYSNDSKIFIEPKASGISIAQQLRAVTMLNVVETPAPKDSKVTRAYGVSPIHESKRVKLVDGSYIPHFLEQLAMFPNATHDDMVDVIVLGTDQLLVHNNPDFLFI